MIVSRSMLRLVLLTLLTLMSVPRTKQSNFDEELPQSTLPSRLDLQFNIVWLPQASGVVFPGTVSKPLPARLGECEPLDLSLVVESRKLKVYKCHSAV